MLMLTIRGFFTGLLSLHQVLFHLKVEVRLFDKLFLSVDPAELEDWLGDLNPNSKVVIPEAFAVPALRSAVLGDKYQFERLGYFAVDKDSTSEKLVFNRTVTLRDSYTKGGKQSVLRCYLPMIHGSF